jgi:hypothetical protein
MLACLALYTRKHANEMNPLQSYPRPDNGRRQMLVGQDKAKLVRLSVSPCNAKICRGHKTDPSTGCMFGSTVGIRKACQLYILVRCTEP